MTKLCNTCEYIRYCARSGIEDIGCDRYKRDATTNEEWFCSLSTEEKAEVIAEKIRHAQLQYVPTYGTFTNSDWWEKWLKEIHE